jgi:hypothetical protein
VALSAHRIPPMLDPPVGGERRVVVESGSTPTTI